jgi:uncharacterized protein YndB with AHSA1/START domain
MPDIEKKIVLRATRARVWRALTRAEEFGAWFGAKLSGSFSPGETVRGKITTPGYDHLTMELDVERVEPERLLAFRWHPYAIDADVDYSAEPKTLVTFTLADSPDGGTALTVTETGFDALPANRRSLARDMNDGGWAAQVENIAKHVAERPQ